MREFKAYMNDKIRMAENEEKQLIISERKDEANLEKIKANIYGVCRTIYEVVEKKQPPDEIVEIFLQKADHLEATWRKSYESAMEHKDVEKIVVEEIKLSTLREVREYFIPA